MLVNGNLFAADDVDQAPGPIVTGPSVSLTRRRDPVRVQDKP